MLAETAISATHDLPGLVFSRQSLATPEPSRDALAEGVVKDVWLLRKADGGGSGIVPNAIGAGLSPPVEAGEALAQRGRKARLVSMPS